MIQALNKDMAIKYFVWTMVSVYPTCVLFVNQSFSLAMLLMVILGSVIFFRDIKAHVPSDYSCEILFIKVGLAGVAVSVVSLVAHGRLLDISSEELEFIYKQLRLLFFIPFLVLMKRTEISEKLIWYGAVTAALCSGICSIALKITNPEVVRISVVNNPIDYGYFSLIAAFVSLNGLAFFMKAGKSWALLSVVAFIAGLSGTVLSGSRGAWLAIPVLIIVTVLNLKNHFRPIHVYSSVISGLVLVAIFSVSTDGAFIQRRLTETRGAIEKYLNGKDSLAVSVDQGFLSVGGRLEMYRVTLDIIKENPVLGVGPGRYQSKVMEYIEAGKADKGIEIYKYPHNDYLTFAACNGIPGLIIFIITAYLLPLYLLYIFSGKDLRQPLFWAGVIIVTGYMVFSLTNSTLLKNVRIYYYCITLCSICASMKSNRSTDASDGNPLIC